MKTIIVVYAVFVIAIGAGWIKNLVKLASCDFKAPYKAEVIHTAGLFPPVGAITGWMDFGN